MNEGEVLVTAKDLGLAAFLLMNGYKMHRRRGKEFDFIINEEDREEFEATKVEFINSSFCEYDNTIMALKKL